MCRSRSRWAFARENIKPLEIKEIKCVWNGLVCTKSIDRFYCEFFRFWKSSKKRESRTGGGYFASESSNVDTYVHSHLTLQQQRKQIPRVVMPQCLKDFSHETIDGMMTCKLRTVENLLQAGKNTIYILRRTLWCIGAKTSWCSQVT